MTRERCVPRWAAIGGLLLFLVGICVLVSVFVVAVTSASPAVCVIVSGGVVAVVMGLALMGQDSTNQPGG